MDEKQKQLYILSIQNAIGKEKLTHFAQRAGVSAGNLSRIRKGQPATPEILRKIADASENVTYADLMWAAGFSENNTPSVPPKTHPDTLGDSGVRSFRKGTIRIPIVSELNQPKEMLRKDDSLPYEESYAVEFDVESEYIYFVANDDALVPVGSRILVDIARKPRVGDVVLFVLDGKSMLRRLTKNGRSYFYYGNDLNKYPMTPVKKSEMEIYGVAVQAKISL